MITVYLMVGFIVCLIHERVHKVGLKYTRNTPGSIAGSVFAFIIGMLIWPLLLRGIVNKYNSK